MILFCWHTVIGLQVAPRAADVLGYSIPELQDLTIGAIIPGEQEALAQLASESPDKEASHTRESVCRPRQETDIPVEIFASLLPIPGQPRILTLIRDITERKRL